MSSSPQPTPPNLPDDVVADQNAVKDGVKLVQNGDKESIMRWLVTRRERWMKESMVYLHQLIGDDTELERWNRNVDGDGVGDGDRDGDGPRSPPRICMAVLTHQRNLPLELMFVASLMNGMNV